MDFNQYLLNLPNLHTWDKGKTFNTGGFNAYHLRVFYELANMNGSNDMTILETGAGNSTLTFLYANPDKLISIAPDPSLFERILKFIINNGINSEVLDYIVDRSEWALPKLAKSGIKINLALIDGCHNWPTVFVDFCYIYYMLRLKGKLIIDDIQLHSIKELARFLISDKKRFQLIYNLGKTLIFQKLTEDKFLPGWNQQPYIKNQTEIYAASDDPFDLSIKSFPNTMSTGDSHES